MSRAVLSSEFLADLEIAFSSAHAQVGITTAELRELEQVILRWRAREEEQLSEALRHVPDDDPIRSPVSLFAAMDYGRLETAQTRVLAWLLGRREHGFDHRLLDALLSRLLGIDIRTDVVERLVAEQPVGDGAELDAGRLDIFGEGRMRYPSGEETSWRLAIEAKIDALEGDEQLAKYDDWLDQLPSRPVTMRVFFTPDGREPATGRADWKPLSFVDLAAVFRGVTDLQERAGYHYLRYYIAGLLREICRLPIPIAPNCPNPYAANEYLESIVHIHDPGAKR